MGRKSSPLAIVKQRMILYNVLLVLPYRAVFYSTFQVFITLLPLLFSNAKASISNLSERESAQVCS